MFRVCKNAALAITIILFLSAESRGEPAISSVGGAFHEGETMVIRGSGFGVKAQPAPLKWDNFESGSIGMQVTTKGGDYTDASMWGNSVKPENVTYSNMNNRPGSIECSKNDMDDYYANLERTAYLKWGTDTTSLRKLYINFWVRYTIGTAYQRHQVKLWRIESHNDESMKFAQYNWGPQDPAHYYQRGTGVGGEASSYGFAGLLSPPENLWFQVEFQALQSNQSAADGSIEIWHSYPIGGQNAMVKVIDLNNIMTRSVPYYWDRVYIGEVSTNLDHYAVKSGTINYFDNFYVDNSWARVVIGDASTYNACRRREVQAPTAWSGTSITVTANTASFPYGTAYLYVVDENGIHNTNGYPVTVESSPKWLANVVNRWQAGSLSRDDLNRAVYWYIKGAVPVGDPMAELTEQDIGNAIKLVLPQ
jgi:hypothetical protein